MARVDRKGAPRRTPWWRTALSWLLLLIFCVSAPLAILAGWARYNLTDETRYVATMQPLAKDPRVQQAIVIATQRALGIAPAVPEESGSADGLPDRVLSLLGVEFAAAATPEPAVKRVTTATAEPATQATSAPAPTAVPPTPIPPTAVPTATAAPAPTTPPTAAPDPIEPPATAPAASPETGSTPGLLDDLGIDLGGAEQALVQDVVDSVLVSPEFERAWDLANRKAWAGLTAVKTTSGPVYLDLSGAASRIQQELSDRGIPGVDQIVIPPESLSIEVLDGNTAATVRTVLQRVDVLGIALPIIAAISLLGSLLLAGNKLVALRRIGFGLAISTIIMLLILLIGQQSAVARLSGPGMSEAAQAVIDTLIGTPVIWGMIAVLVGLALAMLSGVIGMLRRR
jgi:hypothetical protein